MIPDGVAPSQMVGVSASVNLPLHHKVQKFSSGAGSPGWSRKKGRKTVVVVAVVHLNLMDGSEQNTAKHNSQVVGVYGEDVRSRLPGHVASPCHLVDTC